ncbi:MAG: hypothetical protein UT24_C0012G0081 [Candidatus Woesebacteria bacterium GW2011_GWB1_39_12]|uniref:Uncharacterized protein n=2 Tax=Candidatus Woeseibacteriota TaxID=1752722 RepID=A0A0G0PI45_9BACT|nr:MAG: hypothetical protein UT23_C0008G0042 [Candidatus Woesebacteria bacterium GW2011_GWA1_39_12]KKR00459.1 MAG: hypothetical protein UT24_C0012G0081 [Candidatus Woesebacteria bacterium GW2011_GWB1_39_12]
MLTKLKFFTYAFTKFRKKSWRQKLLYFYITGLILGIVILALYAFIPSLIFCTPIFGQQVCTPAGILLALVLSLPGYLIAGNLLQFLPELAWGISLVVIIVVSAAFYYLSGWLIDQKLEKKLSTSTFSKYLILFVFAVLVLILISLI